MKIGVGGRLGPSRNHVGPSLDESGEWLQRRRNVRGVEIGSLETIRVFDREVCGRVVGVYKIDELALLIGVPHAVAFGVGNSLDASTKAVAAVLESVEELRRVLGDRANEPWMHIEQGPSGALVHADDGDLGTESWDISEAMPTATVYHVQREIERDVFSVLVLRRGDVEGSLYQPSVDPEASLADIKGARTRPQILAVLGIAPELLGYQDS